MADKYSSAETLGEVAYGLIEQAKLIASKRDKPKKINTKKLTKEAQSLALAMARLRERVLRLNAAWDYPLMRKLCEANNRKLPLEAMADTLAEMSEELSCGIRVTMEDSGTSFGGMPESLPYLIGHWFMVYYRFFFGEDVPTATYDNEAETVSGPFIRFSRLILDEAGVSLSNAAIAKYPSRVKQRKNEILWFLKD